MSVITPLNGLLFLNFVPVTTLVIQIFQGVGVTAYDYIGTIFIIMSLLLNNIFLRLLQRKREPKEEFKGRLQETVSIDKGAVSEFLWTAPSLLYLIQPSCFLCIPNIFLDSDGRKYT